MIRSFPNQLALDSYSISTKSIFTESYSRRIFFSPNLILAGSYSLRILFIYRRILLSHSNRADSHSNRVESFSAESYLQIQISMISLRIQLWIIFAWDSPRILASINNSSRFFRLSIRLGSTIHVAILGSQILTN